VSTLASAEESLRQAEDKAKTTRTICKGAAKSRHETQTAKATNLQEETIAEATRISNDAKAKALSTKSEIEGRHAILVAEAEKQQLVAAEAMQTATDAKNAADVALKKAEGIKAGTKEAEKDAVANAEKARKASKAHATEMENTSKTAAQKVFELSEKQHKEQVKAMRQEGKENCATKRAAEAATREEVINEARKVQNKLHQTLTVVSL
jgi:hypothetical protein